MRRIVNHKQLQLTSIHSNNITKQNEHKQHGAYLFNKTTPNLGGKFRLELNKLEKLALQKQPKDKKENTNEHENKFYESNFKSCESSMNIYTQNIPYIKNKEMLLFEKYIYDDKYEPDRTHKYNMHKIKPTPHKASTLYKTTIFRNNHFVNDQHNINLMNKTAMPSSVHNNNKPFKNHFYEELEQNKHLQQVHHQLWNPSDTLYKELSLKRNEVYHNYFSPEQHKYNSSFPNKTVYTHGNNNNTIVKKYESSWLINRKFKDEVPVIFPLTLRDDHTFTSKSQETRHDKISHELYKVQYLLNLEEDAHKQNEIVIEYMKERNIDTQYINATTVSNFIEYLKGDFVIESDKTLKDNIMKAMFKLNQPTTFVTEKRVKLNPIRNPNVTNGNELIRSKVAPISSRLEIQTNLSSNKPPKTDGVIVRELFNELETIKEESREKIQKNLTFSNKRCLTEESVQRSTNTKASDDCCVRRKVNKIKSGLNSIIQRLYYNNIEKNPSFYLNVFKKKGKLLEYIMLERTKNKIKYDQFRSKFNNIA